VSIQPKLSPEGVPFCVLSCPSHDGKRCDLLGFAPGGVCEPAVKEMAKTIKKQRLELRRRPKKTAEQVSTLIHGDREVICSECTRFTSAWHTNARGQNVCVGCVKKGKST
jgi:hypothetical protein